MPQSEQNIVLKINSVSVVFDGFFALTEVDIAVERHTIRFFIGPNGAGKTTLLDIICAKTKPTSGTVQFFPVGRAPVRLTGMKEHRIVTEGVGRKFQVPSVFVNLTVMDNMVLSLRGHKGVIDSIFHRPSKADIEDIERILERVDLRDRRDVKAGTLAHGEKQWLEIAMQLVQKPELIMLDEPAAGMGKSETFKTGEILREIKKECSVIVVEHDMEFVKQVADMVTVLHEGKVLMEGQVGDVLADKTVQAVYLGRGGER
ncbi:MAG: urea ABC transporter ATP-binding protein UrtD [Oscillospiraceae bacterium]|jgi:urea transport system ATP-binding protein|nr:urea ABC transporter ATP-binding protein UrtD [Oscillospiraceae bacterium]